MTKERKLWEEALSILDDNLGIEDGVITNRFATANRILDFAKKHEEKLTIPNVDQKREQLEDFTKQIKEAEQKGYDRGYKDALLNSPC